MKLESDFMRVIKMFGEIEQFDMWLPNAHSSLAYIMDKLSFTEEYNTTLEQWQKLALEGNYNDLARNVIEREEDFIDIDPLANEEDKKFVHKKAIKAKKEYELNVLCIFGYIPQKLIPDWFWKLYGSYMPMEELKRENAVEKCCMEQGPMSYEQAHSFYLEIEKYYDLIGEFYFYTKRGKLKTWYPAHVKRQTAQDIIDKTGLSVIGAYRYLIYLKEKPEEAIEKLETGILLKNSYEWE